MNLVKEIVFTENRKSIMKGKCSKGFSFLHKNALKGFKIYGIINSMITI